MPENYQMARGDIVLAEPLETRGIVVAERGRFRVRERTVLKYYARTIEHLLVTTGRTH